MLPQGAEPHNLSGCFWGKFAAHVPQKPRGLRLEPLGGDLRRVEQVERSSGRNVKKPTQARCLATALTATPRPMPASKFKPRTVLSTPGQMDTSAWDLGPIGHMNAQKGARNGNGGHHVGGDSCPPITFLGWFPITTHHLTQSGSMLEGT